MCLLQSGDTVTLSLQICMGESENQKMIIRDIYIVTGSLPVATPMTLAWHIIMFALLFVPILSLPRLVVGLFCNSVHLFPLVVYVYTVVSMSHCDVLPCIIANMSKHGFTVSQILVICTEQMYHKHLLTLFKTLFCVVCLLSTDCVAIAVKWLFLNFTWFALGGVLYVACSCLIWLII